MTHSNVKDESSALVGILLPALKGTVGAVAVMLALAALFSGISLTFGDPDKAVRLFAYAALAVSALLCGAFGMISDGQRRIVVPIISGALYVLVLVILSLFVQTEGGSAPMLWRVLAYVLCVLLSAFGGFIVSGRKKRSQGNTKNPAALMRKRVSGKK